MKCFKYFIFLALILLEIEAKRIGGGGSRRTGSSSSSSRHTSSSWGGSSRPRPQPNLDHVRLTYGNSRPSAPKPKPVEHPKPTQQHTTNNNNKPSAPPIGFDNVNKQTATNVNSAPKPSAPSAPIGFDNVNKQTVTNQQSGKPIGFDNANKQTVTNQQNSPQPSAPIGFDNVNKQTVPNQQNAPKPIGFDNVNRAAAASPGQSGINQQHVAPNQNGPPPPYNQHPPPYSTHPQNPPPYSPHAPNPPPYSPHAPNQNPPPYSPHATNQYHPSYTQNAGYHPNQPHYNNPNYPQQQYHPYQQNNFGSYQPNHYGSYQPPGTNIHYGPVTYINGHQTPSYSYVHDRSDNTLLSLYVGYKIGQLFSYSHSPAFSSHTYHVHHYHDDNKPQSVPAKVNVEASTIVTCDQNVGLLCIPNTSPVCMSNGTIMCITGTSATIPCKDNNALNCVESKIDCTNSTTPGCGNATEKTAALSVPCVSSVTIVGDFKMNANSTETTPTIANTTVSETSNGTHTTIFCVTVLAVPKDVNTTALPTPSPLESPEIKEQASTFFGNLFDHLFT